MNNRKPPEENWQHCDTKVFWGEIAPCQHVVQIYKDEQNFLDLLETYFPAQWDPKLGIHVT